MPREGYTQISALDNQMDYDIVREKMDIENIPYFFGGTGMAASGQYEDIVIDNEANHYIYYSENSADSRVTMLSKDENNIIDGEWQVNGIEIRDTSNYELTEYSFEEFPLNKIYLVAFVDFDNDNIIDSGECSKKVLCLTIKIFD